MANPFNRTINWFELSIDRQKAYKITSPVKEDEEPEDYYVYLDGEYYSLEKTEKYDEVEFEGELKKRCIGKALKDALGENGFSFKGKFGSIAYYSNAQINTKHQDIFGVYTGFEYRIWQNHDGFEVKDYLILDPHIAFSMKASIYDLAVGGIEGKTVNIDKLRNYAVKIRKEKLEKITEDSKGIDGILTDFRRESENSLICVIKDVRTGENYEVKSEDVLLEPRPEILRDVVLKELGINYDVVKLQQEKSFLLSETAAKDRLLKTLNIVSKYLSDTANIFPLKVGNNIMTVTPKLTVITGTGYPKHGSLKEPLLLFDKSDSSATHLQPYHGLKKYGAFTKDKSEIRVALLGSKIGVNKLKGMTDNLNKGTSIMPEGMSRFFNTKISIVEEQVINSGSLEDYIQGADEMGARCQNNNENIDVAVVHLTNSTSAFNYETPYYNVKPMLLENGIASQFITQQTLNNPNWSYANIGSAMYAKTGASPWVLAEDIEDFDMIIGVGLSQAISMTSRAGANPRFIGYANVFDKQGRWMFFETTAELYDKDNPSEQLKNLISESVKQYKKVKKNYPKSIGLHYYQRISNEKIELVNEELTNLIGDDFRIAYITIDKSHPMRLYDTNITDCSYPRANYALLSEDRLLLSTTGFTDLAKRRLGTPQILNISSRQYPEHFVDVEKIAQHILALTRLNYKTLTPVVGEPVTLLFSNLVAKFMAAFSETQFKKAINLPSKTINNVPWFL